MDSDLVLAVLAGSAVSALLWAGIALLVVGPLLLLGRPRWARRAAYAIGAAWCTGSLVCFVLAHVEPDPLDRARYLLRAVWMAVVAVPPLTLGLGMSLAARRTAKAAVPPPPAKY